MAEPAAGSVTVRRMLVGAHLRRLREEKGISRADAGFTIRASESKMSRLELGRVAFKERDVSDLLMLYGVTNPEQRDAVLSLVREANRPGWWREYEDVMPGWFQNYVGLEEAATQLRAY
jgi:transcriptional regulator with XRE-family HTH domain